MIRQIAGIAATGAVLAGLWSWNCSGPMPEVRSVNLTPPAEEGAPYRVEAEVTNRWRGHGQAEVTIRLIDPAGRSVEEDRRVTLEPFETTLVVADLNAPPANYRPVVTVDYPPR